MMSMASFLASEVGDVVLLQDVAPVDGDERLDSELGEVGVGGELTNLPGFVLSLAVVGAIIIDAHGD